MTTSTVVSDVASADRSCRREYAMLTYRLDVIATDVADVVRSAGGWLYDRVGAGWEVNVLVLPRPTRGHYKFSACECWIWRRD